MKRILTKILTICALPLLLIACWQLGSMGHWWGSYIVPPPERGRARKLYLAAIINNNSYLVRKIEMG